MIKVYWTEILGKKSQIMFLIHLPTYHFVIKSMGFLPGNKRRGSLRSKFLNPISVDVIMSGGVVLDLLSITITEEEFVRWLGRVSLDQVDSTEDIILLLKVRRKYESACFMGRRETL